MYSYQIELICIQLYGIKYSYSIQIIFKQIYLTHKSDPNKYKPSGSEWTREFLQWMVLYTPQSWGPSSDAVYCYTQDISSW